MDARTDRFPKIGVNDGSKTEELSCEKRGLRE